MGGNKTEIAVILAVTAVLLFLVYWPVLQNYHAAPADRYYFAENEYPIDMLGDLSYVQQGYHGASLASFNYSTMLGGHPSVVKIEYILIGRLGRALNLSPLFMFLVSRFIISLGVFAVIYLVIRRIFTDMWQRITAYVLVLFGAGITIPGMSNLISGDAEVFTRLTRSAHHYIIGAGAIILALYFLSRTLERPKRSGSFLLSVLFGFIASFVYAPDTVLFISGFPLYILLDTISLYARTKRLRIDTSKFAILFAYASLTMAPVLYVHFVTAYLWDDINTAQMELSNHFNLTILQYFMAAGIAYVAAWIAAPSVIRKGKPLMVLLVTWLVMHPVGEFILSPLLHLNYYRYFLVPYYFAFGVLATSGLTILAGWIQKYAHRISRQAMLILLVGLVLVSGIGTYTASWQEQHMCYCEVPNFDFAYPKKSLMGGIYWLASNTKPDDIVLSSYFAGTLIPSFSDNRVYTSWWYRLIGPPTVWTTEASLQSFYGGQLTDHDAYAFLKEAHIRYILYADQEQAYNAGNKTLQYPFLITRYDKDGVVVYQVP